jgi:hypothetical protein
MNSFGPTIVLATDVLTLVTVFTIWLVVSRSQTGWEAKFWTAALLSSAMLTAAAVAWYPPLAAIRIEPAPGAQVVVVALIAFVAPTALLAVPATRAVLQAINPLSVVRLGIWRAAYGILLLALGLIGGLPVAFFRSAALGDILVGLWALWICTRTERVTDRHLLAWNIFGLIDLLHVIALAVFVLRPYFLANPNAAVLNLLPLVGVPLFIALHVITIRNLTAGRRAVRV